MLIDPNARRRSYATNWTLQQRSVSTASISKAAQTTIIGFALCSVRENKFRILNSFFLEKNWNFNNFLLKLENVKNSTFITFTHSHNLFVSIFLSMITLTSTSFDFTLSPFVVYWQHMPKKIESKLIVVAATKRSWVPLYSLHVLVYTFHYGVDETLRATHTHTFSSRNQIRVVCVFSSIFHSTANWLTIGKKVKRKFFVVQCCPQLVGITNVLCISGIFCSLWHCSMCQMKRVLTLAYRDWTCLFLRIYFVSFIAR